MKKTSNDSNDRIVIIDYAPDKITVKISILRLLKAILLCAVVTIMLITAVLYAKYNPDFYCDMSIKTCGLYYNTEKDEGYGENQQVVIRHYDFDFNHMKIKSYNKHYNYYKYYKYHD